MPGFRRGDLLNTVFLPQSIAFAEGFYTALGANAGTGKYYKLFHDVKIVRNKAIGNRQ